MAISTAYETAARSFLNSVSLDSIRELANEVIKESFEDHVERLRGDAGAIWVVDQSNPEEITIAVNVGARGSSIEGSVSQNLESGLVSKAFKEEQLICDEGVLPHNEKSFDVDQELEQMTLHQIAAPFRIFGKTIGAMTVAQFVTAETCAKRTWGFDQEAKESFRRFSAVCERLFEYEVIKTTLKLDS